MKKILTNKTYLSMSIGIIYAYITFLVSLFVKNTTFYGIYFISNIVMNFAVIIYNLVKYDEESSKFKSVTQALYILLTTAAMYFSVILAERLWDMTDYSNFMFFPDVKMYIAIYGVMMGLILIMNLYYVIKDRTIRQNSTNETQNNQKED